MIKTLILMKLFVALMYHVVRLEMWVSLVELRWFKQYLFDISNHKYTRYKSRICQQDMYLM